MTKKSIQKIAVVGLGKVGSLVATLLDHTTQDDCSFTITGIDAAPPNGLSFATKACQVTDEAALRQAIVTI